jgi:hypothetical protein
LENTRLQHGTLGWVKQCSDQAGQGDEGRGDCRRQEGTATPRAQQHRGVTERQRGQPAQVSVYVFEES